MFTPLNFTVIKSFVIKYFVNCSRTMQLLTNILESLLQEIPIATFFCNTHKNHFKGA